MPRKKRKQGKSAPSAIERFLRPTDERERHNPSESAGAARRITPPILTLHRQGKIDDRQLEALAYYRDQAGLAYRSPSRDSCDFGVRGGGNGPGVAITSAILETAYLDRKLGHLREIARAVVRDDRTVASYCIDKYGGRERYNSRGKFVCLVPVNELKVVADAISDLKKAANVIYDNMNPPIDKLKGLM